MVEVYAIKIIEEIKFLEVRESLLSLLPESQVLNIQRFKRTTDEQRSLFGEVLARYVLSNKTGIAVKDLEIKKSKKGKPELKNNPDVFYNISHSGEWVVVAVAKKQIGTDIEELKEPVYRIAERYFSKVELENLNQLSGTSKQTYFFDLWTLKESYLKMLGKGLTKSLGSFSVIGDYGKFKLLENKKENTEVYLRQYNIDPRYKFSVCTHENDFTNDIIFINVEQLLDSHGK